jgi:uncharacterized membrane protein YeiH
MAGVDGNLDLIGIMTLAFCTALGGGIIRDTLLGALPPAALRDWRYPTIALTAAALVFFLHGGVRAIPITTPKSSTLQAWQFSQSQAPAKPCSTKRIR